MGLWVENRLKGQSSKGLRSGVNESMRECAKAGRRSSSGTLRSSGLLGLFGLSGLSGLFSYYGLLSLLGFYGFTSLRASCQHSRSSKRVSFIL